MFYVYIIQYILYTILLFQYTYASHIFISMTWICAHIHWDKKKTIHAFRMAFSPSPNHPKLESSVGAEGDFSGASASRCGGCQPNAGKARSSGQGINHSHLLTMFLLTTRSKYTYHGKRVLRIKQRLRIVNVSTGCQPLPHTLPERSPHILFGLESMAYQALQCGQSQYITLAVSWVLPILLSQ